MSKVNKINLYLNLSTMTKTKKVMIGVVSMFVLIPLFWGVHYFYVIYNTEELDVYVENCEIVKDGYIDEAKCLNDFYQKCKSTGGEPVDLVKCIPTPPAAHCLLASSSASQCCFTETICKCSFGKGWDNQEGCKFL